VTGFSVATWQGTSPPVRAYSSSADAFAARITAGAGGVGGGTRVKGEFTPVNKLAVFAPWLIIIFGLITGGTSLVLYRRKRT
jgi:hypothetical protein